jgi:hypothetical protein
MFYIVINIILVRLTCGQCLHVVNSTTNKLHEMMNLTFNVLKDEECPFVLKKVLLQDNNNIILSSKSNKSWIKFYSLPKRCNEIALQREFYCTESRNFCFLSMLLSATYPHWPHHWNLPTTIGSKWLRQSTTSFSRINAVHLFLNSIFRFLFYQLCIHLVIHFWYVS